jgi:hypothetical protein
MLRKNIFVRCGKLLEDDTSGDGLPLAGSTVCCKYVPEASNRSRSVRRNCAANFLAESGLLGVDFFFLENRASWLAPLLVVESLM